MNTKLNWITYLDRLPGSPLDKQIADAADIAPSTVSRWRAGQDPRPAHAVAVARAYGLHPFGALVAANYLNDNEVAALMDGKEIAQMFALDDFETAMLATEVARRLNQGE